jgi:glycosyltransferase involved in cell wall biosynthesis
MLSAGQGGLEQSLLDYSEALVRQGHPVLAIVHPDWPDMEALRRLPVEIATCRTLGDWDPFASWRLRRILRARAPALVLTIGRRPSRLVRKALRRLPQIAHVAKTPNYSLAHLIGLDHVLATTRDIRRALIAAGQPEARITVIPNMIRLPPGPPPLLESGARPPVIGTLGRFVDKKGFADLIEALALLRDQGLPFSATIGGSGPQEPALRAQIERLGLSARVSLPGWIVDKAAFFAAIDVFCVPSRHEPFGIVVLEGMAYGRPSVVCDAEGPREIVTDGVDGLIAPRNDPAALAAALARLLGDPALRQRLAQVARETVRTRFEQSVIGARLSAVLQGVAERRAAGEEGASLSPRGSQPHMAGASGPGGGQGG